MVNQQTSPFVRHPSEECPTTADKSNYDLSAFQNVHQIQEIEPPKEQHRIPMGILSIAGTYYLLMRHDHRLQNFVSKDPNENKPKPNRVRTNSYYITIHSNGVVLNRTRNRLEKIAINVWAIDESYCSLGADTAVAALERYLRKIQISPVMYDSQNTLKYIRVTGHYLTLIKEHEQI